MNSSETKWVASSEALNERLSEQQRKRQLEAEEVRLRDQRLDDELKQSFPASDPLPWHHDIDPAASVMKVSDASKLEKT